MLLLLVVVFSVYVVHVALAELLAGVLLSVPKLARGRRLGPGPHVRAPKALQARSHHGTGDCEVVQPGQGFRVH